MGVKKNNAESTLAGDLQASGLSFVCKTGEGALFPTTAEAPYDLKIEKYSGTTVIKRDIVTVIARTGDVFNISARGTKTCVQDDSADPKIRTSNALSFNSGDIIKQTISEDDWNILETEVYTNIPVDLALKLNLSGGNLSGTLNTSSVINTNKGSDIASATTTNIGMATGNFINITGTTTITGFGTIQAGAKRTLRFTGILTLTHNATSLILPSGANIITEVGDTCDMISLGSGNWVCVNYQRKSGKSLISGGLLTDISVKFGGPVSITNGTMTLLPFNVIEFDKNGDYNIATQTFTAPSDGTYLFSVSMMYSSTSSATHYFYLTGGVNYQEYHSLETGGSRTIILTKQIKILAGGSVNLYWTQYSGGTINIANPTVGYLNNFRITQIS